MIVCYSLIHYLFVCLSLSLCLMRMRSNDVFLKTIPAVLLLASRNDFCAVVTYATQPSTSNSTTAVATAAAAAASSKTQ